ncbi:unnamed protein product, partial [Ectocarpus sp. 13 AM-2016]
LRSSRHTKTCDPAIHVSRNVITSKYRSSSRSISQRPTGSCPYSEGPAKEQLGPQLVNKTLTAGLKGWPGVRT